MNIISIIIVVFYIHVWLPIINNINSGWHNNAIYVYYSIVYSFYNGGYYG